MWPVPPGAAPRHNLRVTRLVRWTAALIAAGCAVPTAAPAAVTATWRPSIATLTVRADAAWDEIRIVTSGAEIHVHDGTGRLIVPAREPPFVPGPPPQLDNTDRIEITDDSGGPVTATLDESQGRFEAADHEPGFAVALGAGAGDVVRLIGRPGRDVVRLGAAGVNLNADVDGDATVALDGIERVAFEGWAGGKDFISAGGGAGSGAAASVPVELRAGPGGGTYGGGDGDDVLLGGAGSDTLIGGAGDDHLAGAGGGDHLEAGAGSDVLVNAGSDDRLSGDGGRDRLEPAADLAGGVRVDLSRRGQSASGAGRDEIIGVEEALGTAFADVLAGGAGADLLDGAGGDDRIIGAGGADLLRGGEGDDRLTGGAGDDRVDGGPGSDVASFAGAPGGIAARLESNGSGAAGSAAGDDVMEGIEGLRGSRFSDALTGNEAANVLTGGRGADRLDGRGGPDVLRGGAGPDRLLARDGVRDRVYCGGAVDALTRDRRERVAAGCESATGASRDSAGGGEPSELTMSLLAAVVNVTGRVGRVALRCPQAAVGACRGRVGVFTGRHRAGETRLRRLAPGAVRRVRVRLAPSIARRVRARRRLAGRVVVRGRDADGRIVGLRRAVSLRHVEARR